MFKTIDNVRYFIHLKYDGSNYNGWQVQDNAPSVQSALEASLSTILRVETPVVGAGRTDTGVHAAAYTAHFDATAEIADPADFCYHLNAILPHDIAVTGVDKVKDDAHARFGALSREYKYYVSTTKDPFRRAYSWQYTFPLDLDAMNRASAMLLDVEDFTSFCKLHSDNKTNICHLSDSRWVREGDLLVYTVRADRFLRNMVRALVGTLVDVGRSKLSLDDFIKVIEHRDRGLAGTSAPAQGLFLTDVAYPADIYICKST